MVLVISVVSAQIMASKPNNHKPCEDKDKTTVLAKVAVFKSKSSDAKSYDQFDSTLEKGEIAFRLAAALAYQKVRVDQAQRNQQVNQLLGNKGNHRWSDSYIDTCLDCWYYEER